MLGGRQRHRFVYHWSSFRSDMLRRELDFFFRDFHLKFGLVSCRVTCMEMDDYKSMIFYEAADKRCFVILFSHRPEAELP